MRRNNFEGDNETYRESVGGWPVIVASLKTLLETGKPLAIRGEDEKLLSPHEVLAELSNGRSGEAFAALVARYGDIVYCIARNMCASSSEADEVALNTFVSACQGMASLPTDASLRTWLCGTAVKIALTRRPAAGCGATDSLEKLRNRFDSAGSLIEAGGEWPDPSDPSLECGELAGLLREALDHLEDRARAAFVLTDLASRSAEETASILQTSPREIRAQVHRARLTLREVLDAFFTKGRRGSTRDPGPPAE